MASTEFTGELWHWRGPAPYWFVTVPDEFCRELDAIKAEVTYGWGVLPATVRIGGTEFTTSLFPKDGTFLVPVKTAVRRAEGIEGGDVVVVEVVVGEH